MECRKNRIRIQGARVAPYISICYQLRSSRTGTGSAIGIESGTETESENETGVQKECIDGINIENVNGIKIKNETGIEIDIDMGIKEEKLILSPCWRKLAALSTYTGNPPTRKCKASAG
ncbi:hypothetical protein EVAR_17341_1, partial [Eumeta japonica]